jgi:hypothetical protein
MALFSLTGRSGVRNSIPMLARMQRASEYLHKCMDQPPNGCYGKWQRERSNPAHRSSLNIVGAHGLSRFLLLSCATMRFKSSTKADWASFASLSKRPPRVSKLVVI